MNDKAANDMRTARCLMQGIMLAMQNVVLQGVVQCSGSQVIPAMIDDPNNNHHSGRQSFSHMKLNWTIPSYYDSLYPAK